jgi:hypothetical protein
MRLRLTPSRRPAKRRAAQDNVICLPRANVQGGYAAPIYSVPLIHQVGAC